MAQVLFSFDTEDYTNPGSDDAIKILADILASNGVRGCFNIVGELAVALEERGRTDVINSLSSHEINFHSWRHTWHPIGVEYSDVPDWDVGYQRFINEESRGLSAVKNIFKRERVCAAVPPGNSITAQAPYVYKDLGISVYNGSIFKGNKGAAVWFCNMINIENNLYLEDILHDGEIDSLIKKEDELKTYRRIIICMHPNMAHHSEFWDALNCKGENPVEFGDWKYPVRRAESDVKKFYADFDKAVKFFKNTPGFEIITNHDIWYSERDKRRPISISRLKKLLDKVNGRFFYAVDEGESFALSEIFEACVHFLSGGKGTFTPRGIKGFKTRPAGIEKDIEISCEDIKKAAWNIKGEEFIPAQIQINDTAIGPADFMRACLQILNCKTTCALSPAEQMPDTSGFYNFDKFSLKNSWMYSDKFEDLYVSDRVKLQAWTIRE